MCAQIRIHSVLYRHNWSSRHEDASITRKIYLLKEAFGSRSFGIFGGHRKLHESELMTHCSRIIFKTFDWMLVCGSLERVQIFCPSNDCLIANPFILTSSRDGLNRGSRISIHNINAFSIGKPFKIASAFGGTSSTEGVVVRRKNLIQSASYNLG